MITNVFTSVAANYLAKARVLAHSVKRHNPGFRFHLILVDSVPAGFSLEKEPFDSVLTIGDLGIPDERRWIFKHTLVELSTAVKGPALVKLLALPDCAQVIYLDPDIVVLHPLDELLTEFDSAPILLTPHITEPERTDEGIRDNEFSVLQHGVFNLGFAGVRNCDEGKRFARWWSDRLLRYCYDDIPSGLFTDQKWVDLAPAYFDGCRILRDPVYNVCTWNLSHREVKGRFPDGLTVSGRPLVFYHFSGFDSGNQKTMLDKWGAYMPGLYELRDWYIAECERMGQDDCGSLPWRYGVYDNGEPIPVEHRVLYRTRRDLEQAFPNPFATADRGRSFLRWCQVNAVTRVAERRGDGESSEAGSRAMAQTARRLSAKPPQYRVFLCVSGCEPGRARAAAQEVAERSQARDRLFLIGPEEVLSAAVAGTGLEHTYQLVPLRAGATPDDAFREIGRRYPDMDFLFVKATVQVPELWDIRLAWAASGQQGVSTVSPVCDGFSDTALAIPGAPDQLDRLCFQHSSLLGQEISRFSQECLWVAGGAARAAFLRSVEQADDAFGRFAESAAALRYSHLLADHLYVGAAPAAGKQCAPELKELRHAIESEMADAPLPSISTRLMPRNLHIMHSWGGGLEQWVTDYCRADGRRQNFVLKSIGTWGAFGQELHLFRHIDDEAPIGIWPLYPAIKSTTLSHAGYEAALREILDEFGIDRILVSCLVGHSLEALRSDPPAVMVCHDYYPCCPALNITHETVCTRCGEPELNACTESNPYHRFFRNVPPPYWLELREEFSRRIRENRITMIAPSRSVCDNYLRLMPELAGHFQVVPHGTTPLSGGPVPPPGNGQAPLRVVVLGSLAPQKGLALFREIREELLGFAEVFLLGCGVYGEEFEGSGVKVQAAYTHGDLRKTLAKFRPDAGLLLSVVPETYGYCLDQLFELGIPPVATRIGSFEDRIRHTETGFLCDPKPAAVLETLKKLAGNRELLAGVRERLRDYRVRTVEDMLADYDPILGAVAPSAPAYFCPDVRRTAPPMYAQLFWAPAEAPFRDADSARTFFQPTANSRTVSLGIPPLPAPPQRLRLDPGDRPGLFLLEGMRLYDRRGDVLWSWQGDPASLVRCGCSQMLVAETREKQGALVALTGTDPHVFLPCDPDTLARLSDGGALEMDIRQPPANGAVAALTAGLKDGAAESSAIQLRRLLEGIEAESRGRAMQTGGRAVHADRLAQKLELAQQRIADLENSWSWRISTPLRFAGGAAIRILRRWKLDALVRRSG